jgi:hypothetical protein
MNCDSILYQVITLSNNNDDERKGKEKGLGKRSGRVGQIDWKLTWIVVTS